MDRRENSSGRAGWITRVEAALSPSLKHAGDRPLADTALHQLDGALCHQI